MHCLRTCSVALPEFCYTIRSIVSFRDIRDRSILRLYDTDEANQLDQSLNFPIALQHFMLPSFTAGVAENFRSITAANSSSSDATAAAFNHFIATSPTPTSAWDELSYFSEPEFDSDHRHQHIHRAKVLSYIQFLFTEAIELLLIH